MPVDAFYAIVTFFCLAVPGSLKRAEVEELCWVVNRSQQGLQVVGP